MGMGWTTAFRELEDFAAIKSKVGDIWEQHNNLHYSVMHLYNFLCYGKTGRDLIKQIHAVHKIRTIPALLDAIRKKQDFPLLKHTEELHENRNFVIHGLLMEYALVHKYNSDGSPQSWTSQFDLSDADRLGFGKCDNKSGDFVVKSLMDLDFWNLDLHIKGNAQSIRACYQDLRQDITSLTLPREWEREQTT
jgi:hypothetical protein